MVDIFTDSTSQPSLLHLVTLYSDLESLKFALSLVENKNEEIFILTFDSMKETFEKQKFLKPENVDPEIFRKRILEFYENGTLSEDGKFSALEWLKVRSLINKIFKHFILTQKIQILNP